MQSGTCGDNLTWTLDSGTLTIGGNGEMNDYQSFSEITALPIENVIVELGVTSIGAFAFSFCSAVKAIDLPESVAKIGKGAFLFCERLTDIKIPAAVTEIAESTFCGCWSLETIDLPTALAKIGKNAFNNCTDLQQIEIPAAVREIGNSAFKSCDGLTEITIPANIIAFGEGVFELCRSLKKIYCAENFAFKDFLSAGNDAQIVTTSDTVPLANSTWRLDGDTLTIIDANKFKSLAHDENAPWYGKRDSIKKIIVKAR